MQYLKQSTAITIQIGPFLDETNGKTAETGLTIAQADIRLSKNGGNIAQSHDATGATHDELGWYALPLDATDTDTLGRLIVLIHEAGALPVWREFMVAPANVWDSLFAADKLQVHVAEMTADIIDASALKADAAEEIADAIWDEAIAGHAAAGSFGQQCGTDLDAVLADTDELQGDDVPGLIAALNDPAVAAIGDAVLDEVVEGAYTVRHYLRLFAAMLLGKAGGGGTATVVFRDTADSKDRISMTVDTDGNRTAVSLTET